MLAELSPEVSFLFEVAKFGSTILAILATAFVALFTIHRADQRERDKQRRDDLKQTTLDLIKASAHVEAALRETIAKCDSVTGSGVEKKIREDILLFCEALEVADVMLSISRSESLRTQLLEFALKIKQLTEHCLLTMRINSPSQAPTIADQLLQQINPLRKKIAFAVAAEIERLRTAGRHSFLAPLFNWFERL